MTAAVCLRSGKQTGRPAAINRRQQKTFIPPTKRRMKAFSGSGSALAELAGLILLLTEKLIPPKAEPRRAQSNRYPDSEFSLAPAFPASGQWLWEFVTHYSGVTVPDSHGVP